MTHTDTLPDDLRDLAARQIHVAALLDMPARILRLTDAFPDKTIEVTRPPKGLDMGCFQATGRWPRAKGRYRLAFRSDFFLWAVTAYREGCPVWPYFPKPEGWGLIRDADLVHFLADPLWLFPALLQDERPGKTLRPKKIKPSTPA